MLPNHSPLKIAETFRLLEALYPGRVDLGLGRAPGTDTLTAFALRRSREVLTADDYPEQLAELIAFDDTCFPVDHPFRAIRPIPFDVKLPPIWLLGSSGFSAQLAAGLGLGFAFAAHINRLAAVPALGEYRALFTPSDCFPAPRSMLTVSVTVGDTSEHAQALSCINDLLLLRLSTGQLGRSPTYDEAATYPWTEAERAAVGAMRMKYLAGDAADVHRQIVELQEQSGADEVMITTMLPALADRRRNIVHLAEAFGLAGPAMTTPFAAS
jgi:luciferase family oxidoreductase group 1